MPKVVPAPRLVVVWLSAVCAAFASRDAATAASEPSPAEMAAYREYFGQESGVGCTAYPSRDATTAASEPSPVEMAAYREYFGQERIDHEEIEQWLREDTPPASEPAPPRRSVDIAEEAPTAPGLIVPDGQSPFAPFSDNDVPSGTAERDSCRACCAKGCRSSASCNPPCAAHDRPRLGGWIAQGATTHAGNAPSKFNGPLTFNDREEYQLNQVYMYLEKQTPDRGVGWGGRVDLLYGTDHRFTTARGLETRQDLGRKWNNRPFYGLALPQAYAEAAVGDVGVKLGHFYTIVGYESVMAPANFFYSHAYTMQYGEPFTHTGLLASWAATDVVTFQAGFDRGWDNWEDDPFDRLSYLGGFSWDSGCGGAVAWSGTIGKEPDVDGSGNTKRLLSSVVISQELGNSVMYVIQHDYGWQDDGGGALGDAEWYSINQYLLMKINCRWAVGLRFEWFRDDDGTRVTGLQPGNPIFGDQFVGNFWELTLGLNYAPTDRIRLRPELRYDWYQGSPAPGSGQLPFDDGTDNKQFTVALDAIWTY